ncbi:MAG: fumarylacetoacetate hydrolase family protein [Caldilineaceae bacterium]|nr:fumarylacetoacetate hydrolase family protein [Caldilineaceae bacterium]MCB0097750.1 fumarylacetoacetate hydrolase family protein [Caldilineaceae bacterium]MCB0139793.1 fumarylacetoacetate hydrolase family protein [Caldilineaceae bacterium]MCB9157007.1 fumarylacetoacetate hydrolase family protein [Caldilineaceae bacterium]
MKLARFAYNGAVHNATYESDQLMVGSVAYDPNDVMWLPPVDPRGSTAIGVALGYATHAAELKLDVPNYPILFHKMGTSHIGHKAKIVKPDVEYMHYEGELVVVIGRACRNVTPEQALAYVMGYTIGNECTVRDFVTNYYRPPVKAKGFDTFGPMGPVLVTADEIDPTNSNIRTYVNGELKQDDNTRHLRHSVAELISYISEFKTLEPGDTIWSGTPEGISHIYAGDVIRVEIDGIGALENEVVDALK